MGARVASAREWVGPRGGGRGRRRPSSAESARAQKNARGTPRPVFSFALVPRRVPRQSHRLEVKRARARVLQKSVLSLPLCLIYSVCLCHRATVCTRPSLSLSCTPFSLSLTLSLSFLLSSPTHRLSGRAREARNSRERRSEAKKILRGPRHLPRIRVCPDRRFSGGTTREECRLSAAATGQRG